MAVLRVALPVARSPPSLRASADPAPYYLERTVEEGGLSVLHDQPAVHMDVLEPTCSHPLTLAQRPVRHWWKTPSRGHRAMVCWHGAPEQAVLRACHGSCPSMSMAPLRRRCSRAGVRVALASEKVLVGWHVLATNETSGPEWWRSAATSREGGLVLLPAFMLAALCPLLVWRVLRRVAPVQARAAPGRASSDIGTTTTPRTTMAAIAMAMAILSSAMPAACE